MTHGVEKQTDDEPKRERRRIRGHAKLRQSLTNTAAGQSAFRDCCRTADNQGKDSRVHDALKRLTRRSSATAGGTELSLALSTF
jgi:hypothetical protein